MRYCMYTKDLRRYILNEEGHILETSPGHKRTDWQQHEWRIIGFSTRFNSHRIYSLKHAAEGGSVGQGWIHDIDHGTHRLWGMPKGSRLRSIHVMTKDEDQP